MQTVTLPRCSVVMVGQWKRQREFGSFLFPSRSIAAASFFRQNVSEGGGRRGTRAVQNGVVFVARTGVLHTLVE